jgi:parallel beta-helix repeat protein
MALTRRTRIVALIGLLVVAGVFSLLARFVLFPPQEIPTSAVRVPRDAATLAEALQRVAPGGTIVLDARNGPFSGSIEVTVAGITICAHGGAARIVGQEGKPVLAVRAKDVVLRDLDLSGGSIGLLVTADRCTARDLSLHDTTTAIWLDEARAGSIENVDISMCAIGIEISSSGGTGIRDARLRDLREKAIQHSESWETTIARLDVARAPVAVRIESESRDVRLLDLRLIDCPSAGIRISDSSTVTAAGVIVRDAAVGIRLERATGCEIRDAVIERATDDGILLVQSLQNAVRGSTIRAARGTGIRLSESADNSLSDNEIRGENETAVGLGVYASGANLVASNLIHGAATGIVIEESPSTLVLQNAVRATDVGIVVRRATDCRVVRNRVAAYLFGIGVTSSAHAVVLGNSATGRAGAAFALTGDASGVTLQRNDASDSRVGFLVAASSDSNVLDNRSSSNETGVLLVRCGAGIRLEGNRIQDNAVGLRQTDDIGNLPARLDLLASLPPDLAPSTAPAVANNVFRGNRSLDVENEAPATIHAAGNRWGRRETASVNEACASGNVELEASAAQADVVIGASAAIVDSLLGSVVAAALSSADSRVVSLLGLADSDLAGRALLAGDIDIAVGPAGDAAEGLSRFPLPARSGWTAVVPESVAARLAALTLSSLADSQDADPQSLLWAVPESLSASSLAAFRAAYGFGNGVRAVVTTASAEEAESLLEHGACQFALLPSLEETATSAGFVALADNRAALPSGTLALVARTSYLATRPDAAQALARLAPRLTSDAVHGLAQQVRLLLRSPEQAAREFLTTEDLLAK